MCVSYCAFQKHANSEVQKASDVYIFLLLSIILVDLLRLVFTSDGVIVRVGVVRSCKSAYDLVKIKNRSRKGCHKRDEIRVRRIRMFPFLPTPLPTPSLTFCL